MQGASMHKKIALGAVMALGFGVQAMAAEGLSYSYVEGAFAQGDIDVAFDGSEGFSSVGAKGDGISVSGSAALSERFFAFGSVGSVSLDDWEVDGNDVDIDAKMKVKLLTVGLGFHWALSDSLDLVSGVSFERLKLSAVVEGEDFGSTSDSGFGVSAGLRGLVGTKVELSGNLKYLDVGSSELVYSVGGRFHFNEMLSAGVDFTQYDDTNLTNWGLNVRYSF
jgi:hypothetical protein